MYWKEEVVVVLKEFAILEMDYCNLNRLVIDKSISFCINDYEIFGIVLF